MDTFTEGIGHDVVSSEDVEGTSVYGTDGKKIGSIDSLMIDKRSGIVRYAVLTFGGFLGVGDNKYPLPWSMLKFDTTKDGYVVPLQKESLEKAPQYDDDEPEWNETYGRSIHSHYKVQWSEDPLE